LRQPYINRVFVTEPATPGHYFYDDYVRAGHILVLKNLCANFSALGTTEEVQFFVQDGGVKIFLGEDFALVTGGYPHWEGSVSIGEGDRAGIYIPDSATDDVISFFIFGELFDLADFRG